MKQVVVLGAGLVGRHIALDLSSSFAVTSVDCDGALLERVFADTDVRTVAADLKEPLAIMAAVRDADVVVGALPGHMGFRSLEAVIRAGKDVVDIAFLPEDPLLLDEVAKQEGVTAIVDCGVAPGMSNVLLGYHAARMARVSSYECLVGGLPTRRTWPFEYRAPFSPTDVIEEYTRPARYVEKGRIIVREALSEPQRVDFKRVGVLEALNTDGLRTLITSYPDIPDMKEKTLRYPGHARLMRAIRDAGFLSEESVNVKGVTIRPRDLAEMLIFPHWKLEDGEEEFTAMRVVIRGTAEDGSAAEAVYHLLDRTERETGVFSMARTTGYPAAAAVHLVADGKFRRRGICPPELLGEDEESFRFLLDYQRERGVKYES